MRVPQRRQVGEPLAGELVQLHPITPGQRVIQGAHQVHRDPGELDQVNARRLLLERDEAEVQATVGDLLGHLR